MAVITPAITNLELVLINSGDTSDFLSFIITDSTGDYNALTNPTGYGTPNTARADLALFIIAYNKRYDLTTRTDGLTTLVDNLLTTALRPTSATPINTPAWTVTRNADGWQYVTVYGLRLYSAGTYTFLPVVGEILWDGSVFKKVLTVGGGPGVYTATYSTVLITELEAADSYSAYETVFNTSSLANLEDCHALALNNWTLKLNDESWEKYQEIEASLKAIDFALPFLRPKQSLTSILTRLPVWNGDRFRASMIFLNLSNKSSCSASMTLIYLTSLAS